MERKLRNLCGNTRSGKRRFWVADSETHADGETGFLADITLDPEKNEVCVAIHPYEEGEFQGESYAISFHIYGGVGFATKICSERPRYRPEMKILGGSFIDAEAVRTVKEDFLCPLLTNGRPLDPTDDLFRITP